MKLCSRSLEPNRIAAGLAPSESASLRTVTWFEVPVVEVQPLAVGHHQLLEGLAHLPAEAPGPREREPPRGGLGRLPGAAQRALGEFAARRAGFGGELPELVDGPLRRARQAPGGRRAPPRR